MPITEQGAVYRDTLSLYATGLTQLTQACDAALATLAPP